MSAGVIYGKYFLLGRLNRGGMAEVFLAKSRARSAPRLLALKRTLPEFSSNEEFISMFRDEARIAKDLIHANICRIEDTGEHNSQLFMVMEFLHGKDLKVLQKRLVKSGSTLSVSQAAFIIAKVAEALDFAHRKTDAAGHSEGIVHRDVSPQNVLLCYDGTPKLIDFGIAKAKDRIAHTQVGVLKGKIAYMSPEQATGKAVDGRSDLFSLAAVFYEMLIGENPFKGSQDLSTLQRVCSGQFTPPQTLRADISQPVADFLERAMQAVAADRFQNGLEMAAAARTLITEHTDEQALAHFMQQLFQHDYQSESARIQEYQAILPPPWEPDSKHDTVTATTPEIAAGQSSEQEFIADATAVAPSYDIAEALKELRANESAQSPTPTGASADLSSDTLEEKIPAAMLDAAAVATSEHGSAAQPVAQADPEPDPEAALNVPTAILEQDEPPVIASPPSVAAHMAPLLTPRPKAPLKRRPTSAKAARAPAGDSLLSRSEMLVLIIVALLGSLSVGATYYYNQNNQPQAAKALSP